MMLTYHRCRIDLTETRKSNSIQSILVLNSRFGDRRLDEANLPFVDESTNALKTCNGDH